MTSTRRRLGALTGTAAAAAAAVTVTLIAFGAGVSQGAPTLTKIVDGATAAPLAADLRSPAVSDDGTVAAFVATNQSGAPQAFVRDMAGQTTTPVPAITGATVVREVATAISGDGCRVAFWGSTDVLGPAVAPAAPAAGTPATGAAVLYVWDRCTAGAAPQALGPTTALQLTAASAVTRPSRDGSFVAYAASVNGTDGWHVAVVDVAAGTERPPVTPAPSAVTTVDVSADGQTLAYDFAAQGAAPMGIALVGPAGPVAVPATGTVQAMPSLSADGSTIAFVANGGGTLRPYVYNSVIGAAPALVDATSAGQILQPTITPDGSQVAYVVAAGTTPSGLGVTGASTVVVARSTSGSFATSAQETVSPAPVPAGTTSVAPVISATGQLVLFATTNGTGSDVWSAQRAPALTVTPAFDLGTVAIGSSSPPAAVTFTNPSSVGVALGPVTALAAPFSITADTCSDVLVPPAGKCTVTVVFTPTAADESTASLTVAGPGASATAALSGDGRALVRSISMSPSTLQFPSTAAGSRGGPVGATVRNDGEVAVDIGAVTLGGADAGQFVVTANDCAAANLAPGATCGIEVTAIPARAGTMRATLDVAGTQGESATSTLAITATSVTTTTRPTTTTARPTTTTAAPLGRLSASPFAVTFPPTPIGAASAAVTVTISNSGGSTVSRLTVDLLGDEQYAVDGGSCAGANLAAGRTCTVAVAITPQAGGSAFATLTVSGSRGETVSVALNASSAASATLRVNPGVVLAGGTTTLSGSGFTAGSTVALQLVAPNGGGTPVPVGSVTAAADGGFTVLLQVSGNLGQGGWQVQAVVDGQASTPVPLLIEQGAPQPGTPGGGGGVVRPRWVGRGVSLWSGDDSGGSSGVSMWRSEWGNVRALQDQLDAQAAATAATRSEHRRLSSQLSKLQGDLSQRVDRLARAFDAFVELSQLRQDLVLHADARRWRLAARRLVEGGISGVVVPAGGATLPSADVGGYWLAPAVRGLPELIERGEDGGELEEAARRDELRTATFVTVVGPLLGSPALGGRWVAAALPVDGPPAITVAERAIWLAAADGLLCDDAVRAAVGEALHARLAATTTERLTAGSIARPPEASGAIAAAAASSGPAATIERWTRLVEQVAAAGDTTGDGTTHDVLLSVVRTLVEEGSPEEQPLLDRAEELGVIVDPDMPAPAAHWDDPAGDVADLVVADAVGGANPRRARLALAMLREPLRAAAEQLVVEASAQAPAVGDVRIGGRTIQVTSDGADAAAVATATAVAPSPRRLGPPVLAGLGAALVLAVVLAIVAGPGWLVLGALALVAAGGLWLADRAAAGRDAEAAAAAAASAERAVAAKVEALGSAHAAAAESAARATAARDRLVAALADLPG